jgi:CO dehydrogenase maturation factor
MPKSIAVAGKGGTGKTTITALIVACLTRLQKGPILAIDADPDSNLGTMLGVNVEQTVGELREDVLEEIKNFPAGMSKASYVESGLHQIIEETPGFDLIAMGRGEGAGCYCYLNSLIRKFSEDLFPSYDWVVLDNEAGLEHISRRTTANIDALIVVVNDNPIALNTARTIQKITEDLKSGIGKKYVIMNMVKEERREDMRKRIGELNLEFLDEIPQDETIENAVFEGRSFLDLGNSRAMDKICEIIRRIGGFDGGT